MSVQAKYPMDVACELPQKEGEMEQIICDRCGGIMGCEPFYGESERIWNYSCIKCGEKLDKVILTNRLEHKPRNPRKHGRGSGFGRVYLDVKEF